MARKARERSESGIYHVVLKGNDRLLFVEDDDFRYFLSQLKKTAERDFAEIYAYILFGESAHLVLKEGLRELGESVRALTSAYAVRTNEKYSASGKLFYDRYLSEPVETDDDLISAVVFTHRLALVHGEQLGYKYSSYNNYINKRGIRSDSLMLLLDDSTVRFKELCDSEPARAFSAGERKKSLTDAELIARLKVITAPLSSDEIENMTLPVLGGIVGVLADEGASIRRLADLLELSKWQIEKALKLYRDGI